MQYHSRLMKAALLAGLAALLSTLGCGGGRITPKPTSTYAYVLEPDITSTDGAAVLAQFKMESDGTLTPLSPATVAATANLYGDSLAVDPTGHYLFASGWNPSAQAVTVHQFVVGSDGTISPNQVPSFTTALDPGPFTFAPNGQFAIAVTGNNTVSSHSLGPSGSLALINTVPTGGLGPFSAVIDATGHFAYVAAYTYSNWEFSAQSTVSEYTLSDSGALTLAANYAFDPLLGVGTMSVSPRGLLYAPYGTSEIVEFAVNESNGGLSMLNVESVTTSGAVVFDPSGKYAYVNNGGNSISQFAVDPNTGALASNGPDVSASGIGQSFFMAIDPSGQFLFLENYSMPAGSPQMLEFKINADGSLTPNGAVQLGTNAFPSAVAFASR